MESKTRSSKEPTKESTNIILDMIPISCGNASTDIEQTYDPESLSSRHDGASIVEATFELERASPSEKTKNLVIMDVVEKGNKNPLKLQLGGCKVAPRVMHNVESSPKLAHIDPNTLKVFKSHQWWTSSHPKQLLPTHTISVPSPLGYVHQSSMNEEILSYSLFRTNNLKRSFSCVDIKKQPEVPAEPNVERYFRALQGPELEVLRESENTVIPTDKQWPFLLRFPIACFGICLGLGSQTILCKTLSTAPSMRFMHVPGHINLALWCLALLVFLLVFVTYALKCIFYFEAVRREFCHPVRVNFFFAPWIACMFLALGVPRELTMTTTTTTTITTTTTTTTSLPYVHPSLSWLWWCQGFMVPIFFLELKIYGQWLSGGEKRLSKVANPSTHLSLVGNFVGSLVAAEAGFSELALFFWAVGLAHYVVLFVTLYQRLPISATFPKELHPVFFLFISAPSTASVAWAAIAGDFDSVSRILYFVAMFLYTSLVVRVNLFCGFRFSISWWAYTFPMTASAIATVHYSAKVTNPLTQGMALLLSMISSVTVLSLCVFTMLHIFCFTLFPNDMAIAITNVKSSSSSHDTKKKKKKKTYKISQPEINFLHGS